MRSFTGRIYNDLPEFYRDADADLDYPLLRYLSLLGDQASDMQRLIDRLVTDLVDPSRAEPEWLPWLAQLVGIRIPRAFALDVPGQRALIGSAASGFQAGSRDSLVATARRALTGAQYVAITAHLNGDPWVIGLATAEADTPSITAVVAAVMDADAKPAGYRLEVTFYTITWDTLEAKFLTSDSLDALTSWDALEQTRP